MFWFLKVGEGFFPLFQMLKSLFTMFISRFLHLSSLHGRGPDLLQTCFRLGRLCFYKLKVSHQLVMANIEPSQSLFCSMAHLGDCDKLFFPFSLKPWSCFRKHKSLLSPKILRVNLMNISQYVLVTISESLN